jgi:SWI/SNF-related matrix-associated actin-dependent regulator of chromatin subfamily A3
LTGTPIQNGLDDFGALVSFLQVYPFDNPVQFHTNFVSPTQRGDKTGIERLKVLVHAISLRRTKQSVFEELRLGPRVEMLQTVELNEEERTLYTIVKRSWTYAVSNPGSIRNIFQTITKLRQICDHGRELLSPEALAVLDQGYIHGVHLDPISREPQSCENCGAAVQDSDSDEISDFLLSCLHLLCNQCLPNNQEGNTEAASCPVCSGGGTSASFLEDEQATDPFPDPFPDPTQDAMNIDVTAHPSSKVLALLQNLHADRLRCGKDPIKR